MWLPKESEVCGCCGAASHELSLVNQKRPSFKKPGPLNWLREKSELLRLLLFLLTEADFKLLCLAFRICFPIEPLGGVGKIFLDIDVLREYSHQAGGLRAVGAGNAISLHIGNGHNSSRIANFR